MRLHIGSHQGRLTSNGINLVIYRIQLLYYSKIKKMKEKIISKTKHVEHVVRTADSFNREVIKLPLGGQVLPYFKDAQGAWQAVLVSQYRMALKKKTFEASGGRIDKGETPREALSRELKEETGLYVKPQSIKIVLEEYPIPSLVDTRVFGGIVKINARMVKNKKKRDSGNGERTQVEIFNLKDLIGKREAGTIKIDLMTSRLIDEVAKTAGLLVKKY